MVMSTGEEYRSIQEKSTEEEYEEYESERSVRVGGVWSYGRGVLFVRLL
jgi:hypothetical protein